MRLIFKRKNLLRLLIVLLLLGVSIESFLLLSQQSNSLFKKRFRSPEGTVIYKETGGVGPQTSVEILLDNSISVADLTRDKKASDFVREQARETGAVFIGKDCALSPISSLLPNNQKIKLINQDTQTHILTIGTNKYTIQAQQTFITPQNIQSSTIIKVLCDSQQEVKGYLVFH